MLLGGGKKELFCDPRLLGRMINFDRSKVSEAATSELQVAFGDPEILRAYGLERVSLAIGAFSKWVHAMAVHGPVCSLVAPKRAKLKELEMAAAEFLAAQQSLEAKKLEAEYSQFSLCIRNLAGDVLLTIPDAWSGWKRNDVNTRLAVNGHIAPKSHYYRFVCSGGGQGRELLLAGNRPLAALGPPRELTATVVANEAQPELLAAREAFLSQDVRDLRELKALARPPARAFSACLALCSLWDLHVDEPRASQKWRVVQSELLVLASASEGGSTKSIFDRVREHDPEANPERDLSRLLAYVTDPESEPAKVRFTSHACGRMAEWLHALAKYSQLMVNGELGGGDR